MKMFNLFVFSLLLSISTFASVTVKEDQCIKVNGVIKSVTVKSGKLYNLVLNTKDGKTKTLTIFPQTFFLNNSDYQKNPSLAVGAEVETSIDPDHKDLFPCDIGTIKSSK